MAEYVHQTMEEMLPELEEIVRSNLFTQKETKIILKKREAFEYRLRQRTKTKKTFLNYIEYEEKLLELIKIRKKQNGVEKGKREVQNAIIERIHNLFRLLTTRFSEDVSLWEKHINFCLSVNQMSYITRLFSKILRIHSHREDIWVKAAQFERSPGGNGNPEAARELLLKGQRVLPNSEMIFLAMYQMELELATTILKRKEILKIADQTSSDDQSTEDGSQKEPSDFKLAKIVYKKCLEIFPCNYGFHLKMLNVCSKFNEASHQRKMIVADLKQIYSDKPDVWHGLAMCELNNFKKMNGIEKKFAVAKCLQTFVEGLEKAPGESMWSHCLWGHLNVLELRTKSEDGVEIMTSTLELFQRAISAGHLTEELFEQLIQMLTDLGYHEDASKVSEKAIEVHPTSPSLWHAHLRNMTMSGVAFEDILKAFRLATRKVKAETSWPLWQFVLHLATGRDTACLESLMEDACRNVTAEICRPAKEWSLGWTYRQGGIKKARQVFQSLKCMRPTTLEFYRRYIHIENSQSEPSLELIRAAFEEALSEFGQSDQEVWLNYMEMERKTGKDALRAGQIQQRALIALRADLKEAFIRTNALIGLAA